MADDTCAAAAQRRRRTTVTLVAAGVAVLSITAVVIVAVATGGTSARAAGPGASGLGPAVPSATALTTSGPATTGPATTGPATTGPTATVVSPAGSVTDAGSGSATRAATPTAGLDASFGRAVAAAEAYARAHGVRAGVAVLDLRTGAYAGANDDALFGTGSVVKVMIAARLLAGGQLHGETEALAYQMITRSDDDAANQLWPLAGGPELIDWIAAHYDIPYLGTPNSHPGYWGNTHVTARGLVQLYRAIAADPHVGPWLLDAMQHAQRVAADGTDQFFGIPSATHDFAIKQGWGSRSADDWDDAVVNSTGYVGGGRYAVAILTEGHDNNAGDDSRGYNAEQADVVSAMARIMLSDDTIVD
jgi:hypothetical protein